MNMQLNLDLEIAENCAFADIDNEILQQVIQHGRSNSSEEERYVNQIKNLMTLLQ
jgi:hypothetical protein